MSLSRYQVANALTASPWTKNFRHLLPIPRHWARRVTRHDPILKYVHVRDRIKYWNIVPGDQIRLRGDKEDVLREVLSVNKLSNRVFVRGVTTTEANNGQMPPTKNFHYSRCQLFVGNYEFPAQKGQPPKVLPVFAERIGSSKPYWNNKMHRYDWQRFATRTVPLVPHLKSENISIPWPKYEKPSPPTPGAYETEQDVVAEVTYTPPAFTLKGPIPRPPSEREYLKTFVNPGKENATSASSPVEIFVIKELSNPHSRAKKQARWQAHHLYKQRLLKSFIDTELADLRGRTVKDAKIEAVYRWKAKLDEDRKVDKKRRWRTGDAVVKMERKKLYKEKKELRTRKRLTELVLKDEHNQVIPKDMKI